ncbi:MAG TPA: IPT/TIG domain-containing protein [Ktedonobacteraceae bacterium]|nr:IPT/TIG domain-containing protein [Ktedonobacteraceae bacterium]
MSVAMRSMFYQKTCLFFLLALTFSACGNNGADSYSGTGAGSNTNTNQATIASTNQAVSPTSAVDQVMPSPTPTPTVDQVMPSPTPTPTIDQVAPTPTPTPTIDQVTPTPIPTMSQVIPTVAIVNPSSGPGAGGTTVIITGTGFTGATIVSFGQTSASNFVVNSDTQITVVSPFGSGTVDVTITTFEGTSATGSVDLFTYV